MNAVDKKGETAMHGAAYKHVPSVVRFLAANGAKVEVWNHQNDRGWVTTEDRRRNTRRDEHCRRRTHAYRDSGAAGSR